MKTLLLSTAIAAFTALPAVAAGPADMFRSEAEPAEIRLSDFLGMRIYQSETEVLRDAIDGVQDGWRDIGEVNDVLLSRDGRVEAVLADIGGFLGIGENQIAVEMDALKFVRDDAGSDGAPRYFLVLNAPADALKGAPVYEHANRLENEMGEAKAETAPLQPGTEVPASDAAAAEQPSGADSPEPGALSTVTDPEEPAPQPGGEVTAEALTGANVYDAEEVWIGEVSDLVLDNGGQVRAVIVDVGGFLGIGKKPVALQLADLDILQEDTGLRVTSGLSKSEIEGLPPHEPE
ncbi:PRC-barrel domain-containing protein [Roseobacteraceae bacterium NS-SX3]